MITYTFTYAAAVANNINAVTLTATKTNSLASLVITDDDDTNTPNAANMALSVGNNTLTVTVTAQGATTKTYTVSLTRVALEAPDALTDLMATAGGQSQIDLEWTAPTNDGGAIISGYQIQHSPDGTSSWTDLIAHSASNDTEYSGHRSKPGHHPVLPCIRHQLNRD